jgi:hypothetical protein
VRILVIRIRWRAQGDDFRTFPSNFVSALPQAAYSAAFTIYREFGADASLYCAFGGLIFWLSRSTLFGSYFFLISTSRT